MLAEVGFAGAVLAHETGDGLMLIDGHLRAELDPGGIEGANGFNHHAGGSVSGPMQTVQAGRPVNDIDGPARRKFTIAELKRICAFPDDFILTGSYSQQWERLGNSVPPVMMYHIAAAIRDRILIPLQGVAHG